MKTNKYGGSDLQAEAEAKVKDDPAWTWYKMKGKTENYWDAKTRTECFADAIFKSGIDKLDAITNLTRNDEYIREDHIEIANNNAANCPIDSLSEPLICQKMFLLGTEKPYEKIGWIMDFETPLYNDTKEKVTYQLDGVDLISYNESNMELILLEAKRPKKRNDSDNSLLRAVLEVFTYWKFMDHKKLLYDLSMSKRAADLNLTKHLQEHLSDIVVKKAVILFEDSRSYCEYIDGYHSDSDKCSATVQLMRKLGVDFYGIRPSGDDYEVFVPDTDLLMG